MDLEHSAIEEFLKSRLDGTEYFLVDVRMSADRIEILIDGFKPVDVDFCAALAREVENEFAPAIDDYDLELGSAGLTAPFTVPQQWEKNVGNRIELLTRDNRKLKGTLTALHPEGITLTTEEKVRNEGQKRPVMEQVAHDISFENIITAKYLFEF